MNTSHLSEFLNRENENLSRIYNYDSFEKACENGHLEIAKLIYFMCCPAEFTVDECESYPYRAACENGHLEVAKWLYSLAPHAAEEVKLDAFWGACFGGHLELAKWLYSLRETKGMEKSDDTIFRDVCGIYNIEVANWMCENSNGRYSYVVSEKTDTEDDLRLIPKIQKITYLTSAKKEKEVECCICYGESNARTSCGHYGCEDCFVKWDKNSCPVCRQNIKHYIKLV